jgi:hypothetical protein
MQGRSRGNVAAERLCGALFVSPEQDLQAAVEWTTEDFLSAEPYPLPDITEEMVSEFLEKMTSPSAKGGSTVAGGPPSSTDSAGDDNAGELTGFPYPPPFNQHEVLVPYTTYPYSTIGKLFFRQGAGLQRRRCTFRTVHDAVLPHQLVSTW